MRGRWLATWPGTKHKQSSILWHPTSGGVVLENLKGAIAQLVARLYGIQKVRSSNLRSSTVCVAQGKSAGFYTP